MPRHPLDRRRVEQCGAVLEHRDQLTAGLLPQPHHQVSPHRQVLHGDAGISPVLDPGHYSVIRIGLPGDVIDDHLEQRGAGPVTLGNQHVHQLLERHILVSVSGQRGGPHPAEQLAEGRISRQVRPDHQRVDEEPDQVFGLGPVPVRHRGADHHVVLPAVTA